MLNSRCCQYIRNPFFPGFWGQKWGCGLCILADYTQLYTVIQPKVHHSGGFSCFLVMHCTVFLAHLRIKSGFKLGPDSREK